MGDSAADANTDARFADGFNLSAGRLHKFDNCGTVYDDLAAFGAVGNDTRRTTTAKEAHQKKDASDAEEGTAIEL